VTTANGSQEPTTSAPDLVSVAAELMMRAAVRWCQVRGIDVDADRLSAALRARGKVALDTATQDARDALAASPGLDRIAEQTFAATMALAGIQAACDVYPDRD